MRALKALTAVMGVLILAGMAVIVITIVNRTAHPPLAATQAHTLDEPPGTRILAASLSGQQLAIVLQGGGPDRVAIIDLATGHKTGGVGLGR